MIKLFPHQQRALEDTEDKNKVAYYLDMGLGKTFVGSEKMMQLGAKVNLVICQKSKVDDWIEHFTTHYFDCIVYDGTKKECLQRFFDYPYNEKQVLVINYELAFRRPELAKLENFTLMLDESSLIQNENSKRSKFILKKLHPENVILLSGTPTGGKYERLWSQLSLLGWKISKKLYYNQYVDFHYDDNEGFPIMIIDGYKNVDRLKQKMRDHGCVFMKTEEVVELPEKNFIKVKVEKPKLYDKFMKNDFIELEGIELIASTRLTKRLYARQLASQYNKSKLEAVKDLLESSDDRFVIFYNFNDEFVRLKRICDRLERPVSVLNGSVKDLSNYRKEPNSVCLVQYQAGAKGGNLQEGDKIIYHKIGAYTYTSASQFIKFLPSIYVEDENGIREVCKKWVAQDFISKQINY